MTCRRDPKYGSVDTAGAARQMADCVDAARAMARDAGVVGADGLWVYEGDDGWGIVNLDQIACVADVLADALLGGGLDLLYVSGLAAELKTDLVCASRFADCHAHSIPGEQNYRSSRAFGSQMGIGVLLRSCREIAEFIAEDLEGVSPGAGLEGSGSVRVVSVAQRVLGVAARVLPVSDRGRYSEEYWSELWEVASSGAGCWAQVQYALRQLGRVAWVRGAVLTPRRSKASQ